MACTWFDRGGTVATQRSVERLAQAVRPMPIFESRRSRRGRKPVLLEVLLQGRTDDGNALAFALTAVLSQIVKGGPQPTNRKGALHGNYMAQALPV